MSRPVTETVILRLRDGVDLESVYAGRDVESGTPAHELVKLGNTIKAQPGFIRQFWGQQVENPNIFVWSTDWESFDNHAAFINSPGYKDFMAGVAQVWDLAVAAPVMVHAAFTSDATAAREAPVTETTFLMMSKDGGEEKKTQVEDAAVPFFKAALEIGKCNSFAVGWVFEDQPHPQANNGEATAFLALVGWPSIEAHEAFKASPIFGEKIAPVRAGSLPPLADRGMFHVKFHAVA